MEVLQSLEVYTVSQKAVGIQFGVIGVVLLIAAGCLYFFNSTTDFSNGLKVGLLVWGLFGLVSGIGYHTFSVKLHEKALEQHAQNQEEFVRAEVPRMQKVLSDYPKYQLAFAAFIVISLLVIFIVGKPFWTGIAFATILFNVGMMIVEAYSHISIKAYIDALSKIS